jgi:hypothetical protein
VVSAPSMLLIGLWKLMRRGGINIINEASPQIADTHSTLPEQCD